MRELWWLALDVETLRHPLNNLIADHALHPDHVRRDIRHPTDDTEFGDVPGLSGSRHAPGEVLKPLDRPERVPTPRGLAVRLRESGIDLAQLNLRPVHAQQASDVDRDHDMRAPPIAARPKKTCEPLRSGRTSAREEGLPVPSWTRDPARTLRTSWTLNAGCYVVPVARDRVPQAFLDRNVLIDWETLESY